MNKIWKKQLVLRSRIIRKSQKRMRLPQDTGSKLVCCKILSHCSEFALTGQTLIHSKSWTAAGAHWHVYLNVSLIFVAAATGIFMIDLVPEYDHAWPSIQILSWQLIPDLKLTFGSVSILTDNYDWSPHLLCHTHQSQKTTKGNSDSSSGDKASRSGRMMPGSLIWQGSQQKILLECLSSELGKPEPWHSMRLSETRVPTSAKKP